MKNHWLQKERFLLIIHQYVGMMPPQKAEDFAKRIGASIKEDNPDFTVLVLPHRFEDLGNWTQLYDLNAGRMMKSLEEE